jgi:S-adenosylmethionine-diacylgycerolhomoserine-N-methlytransferase
MISFALSMIPAWEDAMAQAIAVLAPGGELHIVDFGEARGLPTPLRWTLMRWLAHFHVTPRHDLRTLRGIWPAPSHRWRPMTARWVTIA